MRLLARQPLAWPLVLALPLLALISWLPFLGLHYQVDTTDNTTLASRAAADQHSQLAIVTEYFPPGQYRSQARATDPLLGRCVAAAWPPLCRC